MTVPDCKRFPRISIRSLRSIDPIHVEQPAFELRETCYRHGPRADSEGSQRPGISSCAGKSRVVPGSSSCQAVCAGIKFLKLQIRRVSRARRTKGSPTMTSFSTRIPRFVKCCLYAPARKTELLARSTSFSSAASLDALN
jgi:hypothetical protein